LPSAFSSLRMLRAVHAFVARIRRQVIPNHRFWHIPETILWGPPLLSDCADDCGGGTILVHPPTTRGLDSASVHVRSCPLPQLVYLGFGDGGSHDGSSWRRLVDDSALKAH